MVKTGTIGHLNIHNLDVSPEIAESLNVRSVPWIGIGPFTLTGSHTRAELEDWVAKANSNSGMVDYITEKLTHREVETVIALLEKSPEYFSAVLEILNDPDAELTAKIGVGVIMESFAGAPLLRDYFDGIAELASHNDPRVRADVAYYLGLSQSRDAIPLLAELQKDNDSDVAESAKDALEELQS